MTRFANWWKRQLQAIPRKSRKWLVMVYGGSSECSLSFLDLARKFGLALGYNIPT